MSKPSDILAFSPHPDDAELGCGGSLLLAIKKGFNVVIVDLSEGECASRGTKAQRKKEKQNAAEILGLRERFSLNLPDTKIGFDPAHLTAVINIIRQERPNVVLSPYWIDRHPDHENAAKLVRSACFYAGVASVGKGHPHRPSSLFHYMIHTPFDPSFVVDIAAVWEQKHDVLRAYRTQLYNEDPGMPPTAISNPDFLRYHEARSVYFGAMIGAVYGEPFYSAGPLGASGLPGLENINFCQSGLPLYKSF